MPVRDRRGWDKAERRKAVPKGQRRRPGRERAAWRAVAVIQELDHPARERQAVRMVIGLALLPVLTPVNTRVELQVKAIREGQPAERQAALTATELACLPEETAAATTEAR